MKTFLPQPTNTTTMQQSFLVSLLSLASICSLAHAFLNPLNFQLQQQPIATSGFKLRYSDSHNVSAETIAELFHLHKSLIAIPSVTYEEAAIAFHLKKYLVSKGLTVDLQQIEPNRYNVLAYIGSNNETRTLLTTHIDTVPPYFAPYVSPDGLKIYGRSSCDAKGSISSQVTAFLDLVQSNDLQEGDMSLLFVVGEEKGGHGMEFFNAHSNYNYESVIFGEPTENKLGVGHKGGYAGVVNVTGVASHSGYPELGVDAVKILVEFLYHLQNTQLPYNELLGNTTVNVGLIEGGVAFNVVPAHASAGLFFRVAAGLDKIPAIIDDCIAKTSGGKEHIEFINNYPSSDPMFFDFEIPGFDSIVLGYGTDAMRLTKNINRKILYGPGSILVAHGANEFIETDSLIKAVDDYKKLIKYVL